MYAHAIHTNLNGSSKLVYMCLISLLEPEEKKLQQNPEGLNCQHVRMDVKKAKLWALWMRFPAGVYQGSCLSPAGLCPGQTLLSWHVDITSQWSALSFHSFSWKIPAETTQYLLFCCQVLLELSWSLSLVQPEGDTEVWRVSRWGQRHATYIVPCHGYTSRTSELIQDCCAFLIPDQAWTESCFQIPWKVFNKGH